MIIISKTIIKFILSFIFLSTTIQINSHHHDHRGNGLCNIDCNNDEHRSHIHKCEKWKIKNSELFYSENVKFSINESNTSTLSLDENTNNFAVIFELYSRPPPNVL
jgi:hypothetical protein